MIQIYTYIIYAANFNEKCDRQKLMAKQWLVYTPDYDDVPIVF